MVSSFRQWRCTQPVDIRGFKNKAIRVTFYDANALPSTSDVVKSTGRARMSNPYGGSFAKPAARHLPGAGVVGVASGKKSPSIVPIPGASIIAHLDENLGAFQIELTPADMADIDTGFSRAGVHGLRVLQPILDLSDGGRCWERARQVGM